MGFRYKKSVNLGGGIRLNAGKNGIGISGGVKGLRVSHGADGKTRVTASLPGTGISYQETIRKNNSKKQNPEINQDHIQLANECLYTFEATVKLIIEDGTPVTNAVILYRPCTISIYPTEVFINVSKGEFQGSGDTMYSTVNELTIKKEIKEGKFLFKKYKDTYIDLGLTFTDKVYRLLMQDEAAADALINWQNSYLETLESSNLQDLDIFTEDELYDTHSIEPDDELEGYGGVELTCTNCFAEQTVEDWQINEQGDTWSILCSECFVEFEVGGTQETEELGIDSSPDIIAECPNDTCMGDIPLNYLDFDESNTAIVDCPHCLSTITFKGDL
ncbi:DUF4236 domain-containing protein [Niallia taxi]|uniref:DUF4236 domain-containing protein n=1 Tax=Niallia taxi TaxID=2499688 RepID=A0A437KBG3_9BACI|nr:DUF4236 domain-containing protein [Niallia taxi]RVT62784.1 DUF4236 domain-containing protein [Niallia taxi]